MQYTAVLSLPLLGDFGVGAREWYLPHPIQGPLELMRIQTPPTPGGLAYAIGYPLLWITAVFGAVMVPLAGLSETTAVQVVVSVMTAAPLAPIYALFPGTFAANKVQGFALAKAVGVVLVPCIVSYFVTGPWQSAFGIVPHYWALKVFWLFGEGATASALVHAIIGLVWQTVLLMLLVQHSSGGSAEHRSGALLHCGPDV